MVGVTEQLTAGRSFVLLICLLGLFHGTQAIYKCYSCSTRHANDSCAVNPTAAPQIECGATITTCRITRISNVQTHELATIERSCHLTDPEFGSHSKCTTFSGIQTCTVYCSTNLCNDVTEAEVDNCAKTNCRYTPS